jgi:hypothetical protein
MSKPSNYGPNFDTQDAIGGFLDTAAKACFYGGLLALVVSTGFLGFTFFHFVSANGDTGSAANNVQLLSKVMMAGAIATGIGSTYLFWGEEIMHGIQIIGAAALIFAPLYLPAVAANGAVSPVAAGALGEIQKSGIVFGVISILALVVELLVKVKARAMVGTKADQLKYGKGIKEEKYQNRFLGKCWQLPYCRKFVRERCPIYHARRTCWKERVGCMCEEEVIRNAMENRVIPKDSVAAARYIPVNNKITAGQKRERCRQCTIYNEHLKHKYKLALPLTIAGFVLLYVVGRVPMLAATGAVINKINGVVGNLSYGSLKAPAQGGAMLPFQEILLDCIMVVLLAYVLKVLEYVIFKLKV